jgi:bifunctional aspartokinase / homoserine dehydrogenase 1
MRVLKFGGSSVADSESIRVVKGIIEKNNSAASQLVIVVSAMSGVTNRLDSLCNYVESGNDGAEVLIHEIEQKHMSVARELIGLSRQPEVLAEIMDLCNQLNDIIKGSFLVGEVTARTRDKVLSYGEQLSAFLIYNILKESIADVVLADSRKLIITDASFGSAKVNFEITGDKVREFARINKGMLVFPGFIAGTHKGETTTIGRNGSDYSASIIGAALAAEAIEIWTDTDGVMTADPSVVPGAKSIRQLSYNEAMELSHFGAKVIFPASLQPAMKEKIPVRVKNTFNPGNEGTTICSTALKGTADIRGITSLGNISMVSVEGSGMVGVAGVAARLFTSLSDAGISVTLISQASSEHSICVCIPGKDSIRARSVLSETFLKELVSGNISSVRAEDNLAIVAVVGENMRNTPGVAARVFEPLGHEGVNIKAISQGSSELNISFVIREADLQKALNKLHSSMFRD